MSSLDTLQINRPHESRLLVLEPFPPTYSFQRHGLDDDDCILFDAPIIYLFSRDGKTFVYSVDHVPTQGPGDFVNEWPSEGAAVQDILDFYFGDPARMQAKANFSQQKKH